MFWLSGWFYRKRHVINPAEGAGAGYQVRVKVHYGAGTDFGEDVHCNGFCRTDFGDIRFTDEGGSLLDYWMQSKSDGDCAVFWVEVAGNLESTAQTVYVYYGKNDAVTTSNQADTFVEVIGNVVGAWNLEDPADDVIMDYSGYGNHGAATGTTVVAGKWAGKNARSFNGIGDFIQLNDSAVLRGMSALTVLVWFKPAAWTPQYYGLFSAWGDGVHRFLLGYPNQGYLSVYASDGAVNDNKAVAQPSLNDWHLFGLVFQGGVELGTVLDGVISAKSTTITKTNNAARVNNHIGRYATNFANCDIGGVYIFNTRVPDAAILNFFNGYPDATLEQGKVLVRKYAASAQPAHDVWGGVERFVATSDSFSVMDVLLRDKLLGASDAVGAADALFSHKGLLLSDSAAVFDVVKKVKTLLVSDTASLADAVLALKGLGVADSLVMLDWASVPLRTRRVLDAVCLADDLRVDKALAVADDAFVVEAAEMGSGDRRTRLFLVLGDVAIQLTGR
jgi:hypothetical protein